MRGSTLPPHAEFMNALRALLGFRPLYQDDRTHAPGYNEGHSDRSDIGARWMAGLQASTGIATINGRVMPRRPR